jgi:hypothetical protein
VNGYLTDQELAKLADAAGVLAKHGERKLAEQLMNLSQRGARW